MILTLYEILKSAKLMTQKKDNKKSSQLSDWKMILFIF